MRDLIPWPFEEPGTLLHIGYPGPWLDALATAGNEVTVLEKNPANVTGVVGNGGDTRVARFIVGDVRKPWGAPLEPAYDHIWWQDGITGIRGKEWPGLFEVLSSRARKTLVIAFRWFRPGDVWVPTVNDLLLVGMAVVKDAERGVIGWLRA